jgi:hypothetical protein
MKNSQQINLRRRAQYLLANILILSMLIAGCSKTDSTEKINSLERELALMKNEVETLKRNAETQELIETFSKVAYLTPGSDGYSLLHTDIATLTVTLSDIKPYANGSKVTLILGNTSAATINGLKAKLDWGQVNEKGQPINEQSKSKEIEFQQSLSSSSWNRLEVVLEGVAPSALGFVRIRDVSHRGIRLLGKGH